MKGDSQTPVWLSLQFTIEKIEKIAGISEPLAARLIEQGIRNGLELVQAAGTPAQRADLARELGVDVKTLNEWVNRADLARIKGIGRVFSNLLEEAGVDTVKELSHRVPANLHAKLVEVNQEKKLTRTAPPLDRVKAWVEEAHKLPLLLEY